MHNKVNFIFVDFDTDNYVDFDNHVIHMVN